MVGLISSILGFIISHTSKGISSFVLPCDYSNIFFTLGIGLISIGIACISVGIAKKSKKIANDSDDKMESVVNSNFLNAVGRFEDARLEYQRNPCLFPRRHALWKSYTYTIETKELMKFCKINKDYQERFINLSGTLIDVYPWKDKEDQIWAEEIDHFLYIYDFMMKLEVDQSKKDKITNKLSKKLNILLKKEKSESKEQYINRFKDEIKRMEKQNKYRKPFKS